jgi:hypothetical protein
MRLTLSPFFNQLNDEKSYGNFMQENTTAHNENNSMDALH